MKLLQLNDENEIKKPHTCFLLELWIHWLLSALLHLKWLCFFPRLFLIKSH